MTTDDTGLGPELEDIGSNPAPARSIGEMIEARLSRRAALRGLAGAGAAAALTEALVGEAVAQPLAVPRQGGPSTLTFPELRQQLSQTHAVPEGYEAQIVIRWGDPVLLDAPPHDPANLSAEAQAMQFGYNNDYQD
jgi:secreted PhoX family phosphatase